MSESTFTCLMCAVALVFTAVFAVVVMPPLIDEPDILGAFAAGFVNPYSSGYSADVLLSWLAFAIWIVYEAKKLSIRHGWVCLALGAFPGVAVGFPLYLILRNSQLTQSNKNEHLHDGN